MSSVRIQARWQENARCEEIIALLSRAWPKLKVRGCESFLWTDTDDDDCGTGRMGISVSGNLGDLLASGLLTADMVPGPGRQTRTMGWVSVRRTATGFHVKATVFDRDRDKEKPAETRIRNAMASALAPLIWQPSA